MNGADTGQTNARPLERAFLQHTPRRRIRNPGARLQRLVPEVAERIINDCARRFGHEAMAPVTSAEPIAKLRALVTRIDSTSADQGAVEHQDEAGFAVPQVDVGDELLGFRKPVRMRNTGRIFCDPAVVSEHRNRLYVLVTRRAKRQPFGLEDGNTAFALCRCTDISRESHFRAPVKKTEKGEPA